MIVHITTFRNFDEYQKCREPCNITTVVDMAFQPNASYNYRAALIVGLLEMIVGLLILALQFSLKAYDFDPIYNMYLGFWAGAVVSWNCK